MEKQHSRDSARTTTTTTTGAPTGPPPSPSGRYRHMGKKFQLTALIRQLESHPALRSRLTKRKTPRKIGPDGLGGSRALLARRPRWSGGGHAQDFQIKRGIRTDQQCRSHRGGDSERCRSCGRGRRGGCFRSGQTAGIRRRPFSARLVFGWPFKEKRSGQSASHRLRVGTNHLTLLLLLLVFFFHLLFPFSSSPFLFHLLFPSSPSFSTFSSSPPSPRSPHLLPETSPCTFKGQTKKNKHP